MAPEIIAVCAMCLLPLAGQRGPVHRECREPEPGAGWIYVETSRRSYAVRGDAVGVVEWEPGETAYRIEPVTGDYGAPQHACPITAFLDDPITKAYGLGGDWDEWSRIVRCPVCEEWE